MRFARTLAVAAATAVVSLGAGPIADAALAGKPGGEPCAKQEQRVAKAQEALAHVTAVFEHQKTKVERLQEALAAATSPEEQARLQARLDKALAQKHHDQKAKKAQLQRLAKAQARLDDCEAALPAPATA
jgi:septal ring factor EnvC (AmiA/AmiB activator)